MSYMNVILYRVGYEILKSKLHLQVRLITRRGSSIDVNWKDINKNPVLLRGNCENVCMNKIVDL